MGKKKQDDMPEGIRHFSIMMEAVMLGITPEEYAEFYAMIDGAIGRHEPTRQFDEHSTPLRVDTRRQLLPAKELKDAHEKTLILRVQMKDVIKPPMWRELKVPADFTFAQLHKAIQGACRFEDAHLWQFQRKAYDSELEIGIPSTSPHEMGLEECTHDARTTGITAFLAKKGDKLIYVYDFGDDWIFNVSVVDVIARDGEVAECIRWKSDLQPLEDSGGVWTYVNMREAWDHRDSLTKRQKNELVDSLGFDSFDELEDVISDSLFDAESVNDILADI